MNRETQTMSTTILTVLKAVPWSEVIAAAPAVADNAKKLWKMARASRETEEQTAATGGQVEDATNPVQLRQQIVHLENRLAELQAQMEQSAQVMRELADQNTVLIARIELNRRRLKQLAIACGVAVASLVITIAVLAP